MSRYVCTMSSAKQNLARAQREEYTWWQWKRWKSKEQSSLLFFSRTVMKYCSGPSVPLHAASGQSRQLGDSRFLSGDKNKMSATLWAGLFVLCAWTTHPLPVRHMVPARKLLQPMLRWRQLFSRWLKSGHMTRRGRLRSNTIAAVPCLGATA